MDTYCVRTREIEEKEETTINYVGNKIKSQTVGETQILHDLHNSFWNV
jgi:hypothetical protein